MGELAAFPEVTLEVDSHLVVGILVVDSLMVDNLVVRLGGLEEGILEEDIQEDSPVVPFLEDRLVVGIPLEEVHHHEPQPLPLQQQQLLVPQLFPQIYGFSLLLPLHSVSRT